MQKNYLERLLRGVMYTLFAFLPIFFVPVAINVEIGRDIVFAAISFIAFALWSVDGVRNGKLYFVRSLSFFSALYFLCIALLSSYLAKAPYFTFLYAGVSGEKGITILIGIILLLILPKLLQSNARFAMKSLHILLASGAAAGLLVSLQFIFGFSVLASIFTFAQSFDFNAVGTVNGLAMVMAGLLVSGLSLVIFEKESSITYRKAILRSEIIVLLLTLSVIKSSLAFLSAFFGLTIVYILYTITNNKENNFDGKLEKYQKSFLVYIGVSIIMALGFFDVLPQTKHITPVEISTAQSLTWRIGMQTVKSGYKNALVGVGPASFGESWDKYRDKEINKTNFWSVKFSQGSSWFASSLTNLGFLGFLGTFLLFIISPIVLFLRTVVLARRKTLDGLQVAYLSILICSAFSLIFYSTILAVVYLFFISLSLFLALIATEGNKKDTTVEKLLAIENIETKPHTHASGSLLSLIFIAFIVVSLWGIFFEIKRARSVFLQAYGYIALASGDIDSATSYIEHAVEVDSKNPQNQEALFDVYNAQNTVYLAMAAKGVDVKNDVNDLLSKIQATSKSMIALNPGEASLWAKQAHLYESLVLFIPNAEKYAATSIKKSLELDPNNPQRAIDVAKVYMTIYDRMIAAQKSSKGEQSKAITELANDSLANAVSYSEKAISMKPDFVLAHIVRAYVALRESKNDLAITEITIAKSILPNDASMAFESGIIRYKTGDIAGSEVEFKRALDIDVKYSNARYYLAIVQYELGKTTEAVKAMEEVVKANPGNKDLEASLLKFKNGESVSVPVTSTSTIENVSSTN